MVRRSILLRFLSLAIMIARSATFVVCPRTGEGSTVRLASTKSNEMESPEKQVKDEDMYIKQTNLFISKLIEQHEAQLKTFQADKIELIKAKDETIQAKDEQIKKVEADKIELIQAKDEQIKKVEADKIELIKAKDETIKKVEADKIEQIKGKDETIQAMDELIRANKLMLLNAEAELSKLRAKYDAELNLRPMLELLITQWCKTYSDRKDLSSTKAFEEFARKQGDEIYTKFYKPIVVRKMGSFQWRRKDKFTEEISKLFSLLSKDFHNTRELLSLDIKGFIVNRDLQFSSVVSSVMMYFQIPHTVMSNGYTNVVYTWPDDEKGLD